MNRKTQIVDDFMPAILKDKVIYVKGCGNYWMYERENGIRGMRYNNRNYDMVPYLRDSGGDRLLDIYNVMMLKHEVYNFLIKSSYIC